MRALSRREHEILVRSLLRWIDLERTAGNVVAAALLQELLVIVQRERIDGVAA